MAKIGVKFLKGTSSVQAALIAVAAASSMRRAMLLNYSLACASTPADATFDSIVQRCTTAGTGTALTPNSLDPADSLASTIVAKDTVTADPTLTAAAFVGGEPFNQRGKCQWYAAPGSEIIIPATASNGIIIGLDAATTTNFGGQAQLLEL